MIPAVRNGVLLCTSPLQIVSTRSAIDYLEERDGVKRVCTVVMIHPRMLDQTKATTESIARCLGCQAVLDYSSTAAELFLMSENSNSIMDSISRPIDGAKLYAKTFERVRKKIQEKASSDIGPVDEIYCRIRGSALDQFFINTMGGDVCDCFGIEDGLGDYIPKHWRYSTFSFYDIQAHQLETIKALAKLFIFWMVLGSLKKSKEMALPSRTKRREKFSVLPRHGETVVGDHLITNIKKLAKSKSQLVERCVLIIGTLFDSRFQFGFEEEIALYQKLFVEVGNRHKVNSTQIWYRHHPRSNKDLWEKKKNRLDCQFFEYNDSTIVETEFLNPHLVAVYSVGSTSLIYAKSLFNIDSYFIDLSRNPNVHPSSYKQCKALALKYAIPVIELS